MAGGHGGPSLPWRSDRHDRNVLFRIQTQSPQTQSSDEVGAGAQLADADPLPSQIIGVAHRRNRDDHIIQSIAHSSDKRDLPGAPRPGANGGGTRGQLNEKLFRQKRLNRGHAAGYEYRFESQPMFFEGARTVGNPEVAARSAEGVRGIEILQSLRLGKEIGGRT